MTQFRTSRLLSLVTVAAVAAPAFAAPQGDLPPPPAAKPGECFGRVLAPPVYGTENRKVLVKPGGVETRTVAGATRKVKKKILVKAARTEKVKVAPVYKDVVKVVYTQGPTRTVRHPAVYDYVEEKVLLEAAHAEWQRVDARLATSQGGYRGQTMVEPTGEVLCRVWVPARYGYVKKKILISPARVDHVQGVARPHKVLERKLVRAGGWRVKTIPAVYRTEWTTVSTPARTVQVKTKAVYRTETATKVVKAGGLAWERVFCGGQLDPDFMAKVQRALAARGFDPGPADGQPRPETYAALRKFQAANNLGQGQLTIATARALGVW
jgi:hypothetical protein